MPKPWFVHHFFNPPDFINPTNQNVQNDINIWQGNADVTPPVAHLKSEACSDANQICLDAT